MGTKTAVVYLRVSSQGQADRDTIEAQRRVTDRLIREHDCTLMPYGPRGDGTMKDDGVSGSLLAGREFAMFVDDVEAGRCRPDYVIVGSISRLTREWTFGDKKKQIQSSIDNARVNSILRAYGVKVLDKKGVHEDFRQESLQASIEVSDIRERTMDGKAKRLADGKMAQGGKPPWGYQKVAAAIDPESGKQLGWDWAPHPEEAERLQQLIALFIKEGAGGYAYAAREATKAEILTPMHKTTERGMRKDSPGKKRRAKDWTPTRWLPCTVRYILRNARVYLGETTYTLGGETHTLRYPPLIDRATYAAIVRRAKERTVKPITLGLTSGMIDCACGAHIAKHNSHGTWYSRCRGAPDGSGKLRKLRPSCGSMREQTFAAALWTATVCRLVQVAQQGKARDGKDTFAVRLQAAKAAMKTVQGEIEMLTEMRMGGLNLATWRTRNDKLNDRLGATEDEIARIEGERAEQEQHRATVQTVEARVAGVLADLVTHGEPPLERKRKQLADLLTGGRAVVAWPKRRGDGAVTITLPALGTSPALAIRVDHAAIELAWTLMGRKMPAETPADAWQRLLPAASGAAPVHPALAIALATFAAITGAKKRAA
jgi:DNA invertase Pin-like site-specific DNA recombinase